MGVFVAEVRPRWSDMDSFGHVNHANTVTLLEEARVDLLFGEGARHGA
ncbi:MAG TPA: thioesterase family protein, partial [Pseudonocardiaceae bacterium]|nr:thioesterase family protein [Pseudonocardiaceae bacterium]